MESSRFKVMLVISRPNYDTVVQDPAIDGQSLEIAQKLEHKGMRGSNFYHLGDIAKDQGDYPTAKGYYERCLGHLGELARSKEDWETARDYYNQSLEHAKKLGDQELLGCLYFDLGKLSESLGRHEEALRFLLKSSLCFIKLGRHESSVTRAIVEVLEDKFGIDRTRYVEILAKDI